MDINSLAHTKWNCKYHIVFAPKYRRKVAYGKMKQDIAYTYDLRNAMQNLKYKYENRHFWCRGYYVDTVGKMQRRYKNIFKISYTGRLIYAYSHYNMCAGCFCLL